MKKHVISILGYLKNENITDEQCVEIFKMRNKTTFKKFSKEAARSKKIGSLALETKLKILETKIRYRDDPEYIHCKEELDKLYQGKINGALLEAGATGMSTGENRQSFS